LAVGPNVETWGYDQEYLRDDGLSRSGIAQGWRCPALNTYWGEEDHDLRTESFRLGEREKRSAAQSKSLSGSLLQRGRKGRPLLVERAGVRGIAIPELLRSGCEANFIHAFGFHRPLLAATLVQ